MKKLLLILSVSFLMQSCFVAKNYERQELPEVSDDLFRTNNLPKDSLNMADISWRQFFTDPQLVSLLERGLENNMDIRIALQQILAAEAYVKQGKAGYLPTLSAGGNVSHQVLSRNSQFGSFFEGNITQYNISSNLSWEADIWGRIRSTKRAFEATYLQSVAAHQAVKTELIAAIANSYYQLLALDEQKRITEQTIQYRESSLETTLALKEAGEITEVGVQQTQAQLYTAQAILIDINNEIRLLENSLSILLGEAPSDIPRSDLDQQEITTSLNIGVPVQLLRNRPDVIAAEYNLINAFELTNVARSNFYPSLNFTASGGLESLELKDLFDANSLFASFLGSIAQPILNQRRIRTAYEVSQSEQEQALLSFRQSLLIAGREVSDALFNYEANTSKIEVKTKEFEAYNNAAVYSEELLANGFANYLEVITARENALNSRLDLINAEFNQLRAIVDLYQALGGGWE